MELVSNIEEAVSLVENAIIGTPKMEDVTITFSGRNNILYCEEGVSIVESTISFKGSNALLLLRKSGHAYRLAVDLWNDTTMAFDRGSYFNGELHAIASERQSIVAGRDCLFSFGIWMRTADPHLLYSSETGRRLNNSKPIYIGDHVWVGQDAFLLKGTCIGSGSIVAARSLVAGKTIPSNTCWGGSPARKISEGVFFCSDSVHAYSAEKTKESQHCAPSQYVYEEAVIPLPDLLNAALGSGLTANQRLEAMLVVFSNEDHNRFAIVPEATAHVSPFRECIDRLAATGRRLYKLMKKQYRKARNLLRKKWHCNEA